MLHSVSNIQSYIKRGLSAYVLYKSKQMYLLTDKLSGIL